MADPKDIPLAVREAVRERDQGFCRACGQFARFPHAHHIIYRSAGGKHTLDNLITLGGAFEHDCHARLAHGRENRLWQELFQTLVHMPGVSGLQLRRWTMR